MAIEMTMPKVDKDQETCTVVEWLKTEGQQVKEGEIVLVIETDKISIDVESPGTGTLGGISAHPGDTISVGTVIAYIMAEGEDLPEGARREPPLKTPKERVIAAKSAVPSKKQIPLDSMRRTIVERLSASYQSIPHIQFQAAVDMTKFNKVRKDYNDLAKTGAAGKVSVTALLVKVLAETLADHLWLNSSLLDEVIYLHKEINIGLAVALENGLIIPVLKNANQKDIHEIAAESRDLIARARDGRLIGAEVKGATFTLSNLGPFGVEQFTAIINPPEVGVLAVGAIAPGVVAGNGNEITVRPIMRCTLSVDHRVIDGAVAAKFIADLKAKLEHLKVINH